MAIHYSVVSLMIFGLQLPLHLCTLPCYAAIMDTISPGQELASGDKILSSNGRFALGFFQTERSSSDNSPKWYLGIWFHTVPKFTPAWVANRENPIANLTSCKLLLSHDGNLVILANHHQAIGSSTVWSSKANTITNNTIAALLDDGNLVLRSASNASIVFWQSFDHPTDTLLQGAKMGWNNATGLIRRLVSTKNTIDQSPSMYSFELLGHNGDTSMVSTFNSSKTYWSSGDWDGQHFSNMPETVGQTWLSVNFISNEQEKYVEYRIEDPTVLSRCIMDVSGQLKVLVWFEGSRDWQAIFTAPKSQCDVYASCGPFTVCNDVPFPSCTCMKGYSIQSPQDWELDDRTGGCTRNTPLYCEGSNGSATGMADKFYSMPSVQLPSDAQWISGTAITSKVDVYSYGMVLLDIISGSRNSTKQSSLDGVHEAYFPVQVARSLLDGDIASLVDPKLCGEANLEEVERVCKVACWCIQDVEFDRPTMSQVVQFLEGLCEVETPPVPRMLQAIAGHSQM
ncbi:unnamed protein product [Urochloa humidicola]